MNFDMWYVPVTVIFSVVILIFAWKAYRQSKSAEKEPSQNERMSTPPTVSEGTRRPRRKKSIPQSQLFVNNNSINGLLEPGNPLNMLLVGDLSQPEPQYHHDHRHVDHHIETDLSADQTSWKQTPVEAPDQGTYADHIAASEPSDSFTPDPAPAYEPPSYDSSPSYESSSSDFSGGSSDGGGASGDW